MPVSCRRGGRMAERYPARRRKADWWCLCRELCLPEGDEAESSDSRLGGRRDGCELARGRRRSWRRPQAQSLLPARKEAEFNAEEEKGELVSSPEEKEVRYKLIEGMETGVQLAREEEGRSRLSGEEEEDATMLGDCRSEEEGGGGDRSPLCAPLQKKRGGE